MPNARPPDQADWTRRQVSTLRLGSWSDVGHRLLARLVAGDRAGPLARPLGQPFLGRPRCAPMLDVGIDLANGVGRIDHDLIRAWAVGPEQIWSRARANLAARARPTIVEMTEGFGPGEMSGDQTAIRLVADGPWTGGWLLEAGHLVASGSGGPVLAVAPGPELLVVAALASSADDPARSGPVADAVGALARRLRPAGQPDFRPVTVVVTPGCPFPCLQILE